MSPTQKDRVYQIESPFGADVLLLRKMVGRESISQPYEWHLDMLSENGKLPECAGIPAGEVGTSGIAGARVPSECGARAPSA